MDASVLETTYEMNRAKVANLYDHLLVCSPDFVPPLSDRVNLGDYARKLFQRATTFEAWSQSNLIGLVAAYFNDSTATESVFITNVSVVPEFRSRGTAHRLMTRCHEYAVSQGISRAALETSDENQRVVDFYRRLGYVCHSNLGGVLQMEFQLSGVS